MRRRHPAPRRAPGRAAPGRRGRGRGGRPGARAVSQPAAGTRRAASSARSTVARRGTDAEARSEEAPCAARVTPPPPSCGPPSRGEDPELGPEYLAPSLAAHPSDHPRGRRRRHWETRNLLDRLRSGREPIRFAPAWTDEVEDAVEDLVEVLPAGESVTVVVGLHREPWEDRDEDGDLVASGHDWTLEPVPRPKSVAHDMLVSAHTAGAVDLEARVHRIDDESGLGAIVELVAWGPF